MERGFSTCAICASWELVQNAYCWTSYKISKRVWLAENTIVLCSNVQTHLMTLTH